MESKTFCILPWIHASTKPSGTLRLCCGARGKGVIGPTGKREKIQKSSLQDWWNGPYMKDVRMKMLMGGEREECRECYNDEKIGRLSKRLRENARWKADLGADRFRELQDEALRTSGALANHPLFYDLRFGNLCNLKCRSCNAGCSDKIHQEDQKLVSQGYALPAFMEKADAGAKFIENWPESDWVWQQLEGEAPRIREFYFAGGEPTLINKNWVFMQYCVDKGHAKNISVSLNTNATYIDPKKLEILGQFRRVTVGISIDGIGPVNDYIRHGSKWNIVESNIDKYLKGPPNLQVSISPTVMIYNISRLSEILSWYKDKAASFGQRMEIWFNILRKPEYLSVKLLGRENLTALARELSDHTSSDQNLNSQISQVSKYLLNCPGLPIESRHRFWQYTKMLDGFRRQSVDEVLPELKDLLPLIDHPVA